VIARPPPTVIPRAGHAQGGAGEADLALLERAADGPLHELTEAALFARRVSIERLGQHLGMNYSGCIYSVRCGAPVVDAEVVGTGETFLDHLREAIAWGGFPGFARIPDRPPGYPHGRSRSPHGRS
jgi:hypothetical protein